MQNIKDSSSCGKNHGFTVVRTADVPSLDASFTEFFHPGSGARYIHMACSDREKAFAVAFKTVPADSTGVAHILEHTALCGSARYPVRDPFFSMLRRSLATFMNAFTSSDWTMYPFCTQNEKDFENLLSVYLDAAFFPKLSELSFKQEGVRLTENPGGDPGLSFAGVVYNEMKGAMSSPDQIMVRSMMAHLYPDTTYGFNSGGDPEHIPGLTHQGLVDFHRRHCHPSNAWFFSWGDLDLDRTLALVVEQVLSRFSLFDPRTGVAHQPRWDRPRRARISYPVAGEEDLAKKSQAALSWLVCPIEDSFEVLSLSILERILLGHSASPLRKALLDSGLGTALSDGTGLDTDMIDALFSAGLKDVREEDSDKVAQVVLDSLADLAEKGIEPELTETALAQYEFVRREITNQPFGYGLKLLLAFMGPWLHGGDPLQVLLFEKDLARVREEAADGLFERLIRERFLENTHRLLLTMAPDPEMPGRLEEEERIRLRQREKELPPNGLEKIQEDDARLAELQETAEDVSVLPTLTVADVPPGVVEVPDSPGLAGAGATAYTAATNGILYVRITGDLSGLPHDLLPLAPFFCHALTRAGSARRDYVSFTREAAAHTGGIHAAADSRTRCVPAGEPVGIFSLDGRCLEAKADRMADLMGELLTDFSFSDTARLRTLIKEYSAGLSASLVQNGHRYAISLAARGFSKARGLSETWHGVHQIQAARELAREPSDQAMAELGGKLSEIARFLFTRGGLSACLVGGEDALKQASGLWEDLLASLPPGAVSPGSTPSPDGSSFREAWTTATSVSFVAQALGAAPMGHPDAPVLAVLAKLLRSGFLHREIREKGGAYGGFAVYNPEDGLFALASYRDPHLARTLDVFTRACQWAREGDYTDQDVSEAILQVAGDIDHPNSPGIRARKAFVRKILGLSDNARREFKEGVLATDRKRIRQVAEAWLSASGLLAPVAVITGASQLAEANHRLGDAALETREV
ncbi:MAG: insulinase family protein [Pseudomonadota bacterium]